METHTYPFFPTEVSTVHFALYQNVANARLLRSRLVAASTLPGEEGDREREAVNYAFVDPRLVTSRLQIQTAIYQAILAHVQGSLRTKTIHSEVLWILNPSHNISEAIKRFGVSDTSTGLLVVRVCPPTFTAHDFEVNAGIAVLGSMIPMSSLQQITDWRLVRKYYKQNADQALVKLAAASDQAGERALIDELVVSCIAMKSVSA